MCAGDVKGIAAGSDHSIVLRNNGDVWTTGRNDYGQLGDGTLVNKNRFVFVIGTWDIALGNTLNTCTDLPVRLQQTLALDRQPCPRWNVGPNTT